RGDRYRTLSLYALDEPHQIINRLFGAQRGLVADHDRIDVAVAAGKRNGGLFFPLVSGFLFFRSKSKRKPYYQIRGDRGHQLTAAGRTVGADRLRIGTQDLQVGTDLLRSRAVAIVRML